MADRGTPRRLPGVTYGSVMRTLQGNYEGIRPDDRDYMFSVLCAVYPEGASLSAMEATEALLRAGFTRPVHGG